MNYKNVLGFRIAQLRKENGWTQKQLADKLNVDNTTISSWELGKNDVPTAILVELAKLFDTTTDYLLGLSE
ncbi:MAG: helix-turn-helix transcriptional regulator [Clostridia bacterium]|nr:helix-turn-helix transcriptional regulator [Clostridia bacterium]